MNNGKICVSVCASTTSDFFKKCGRAVKVADVVELRFDCLEKEEFNAVLGKIAKARQIGKKPLLATFRPESKDAEFIFAKQTFSSDEHKERVLQAQNQRRYVWKRIWAVKGIDFIDVEGDLFLALFYNNDWFDDINLNLRDYKIITSEHNFERVPEDIESIYDFHFGGANEQYLFFASLFNFAEIPENLKNNIIKIAVQANDAADGLALMKLLERAKAENKELIPIAMGEHGIWTRILGLSRGAFMTFASLDDESATAPGQLTAQEMIDVYRVKELDENTEIYGLVAGSTAHSVSPQMHNAAFKFHNLNAVYVPFAVKNLEEFIRRMVHPKTREIDWKLRGLSVTIPHKIEIIKYLDFVDETARQIGAVNTVKIEGDKLYGFNTDAAGFLEPLKNSFGDLKNAQVAVFGAGGVARAVVYALQTEGANVTVFARDVEKAKTLENDFAVKIDELSNYGLHKSNYDIVVNTTPLGMKKEGLADETPATAEQLKGVGLVYDLVYNPFETRLMREAQAAGVPTIGGLAMLVAQAMQQQKIWTNLDAPIKEMSQAALKKLT